jgi:putative SOS response-associated peptidase YedK
MCRWAKLETDVSEIKIAFRIPPEYPTPNFAPSWNVAPADNLPIVRYDAKAGSRTLDLMRWGLVVPYWAKEHQDRLLDHQCDGGASLSPMWCMRIGGVSYTAVAAHRPDHHLY